MSGFLRSMVWRIGWRFVTSAVVIGSGQYYLSQSGGLPGIVGQGTAGAMASPISAGLNGLASLGLGGTSSPSRYQAQGRISTIQEECRLVRQINGKIQRTEPLSCDRARTAMTYPQFNSYTLNETRVATYIYFDMDGVNILKGTMDARPGQVVGDVIPLSINRTNPRDSTPI